MDLITVDFETYYDKVFSLGKNKLTIEEYVRDARFEVVGVAIKVNNSSTEWASGTHEQLKDYLSEFNWADSMVLAHNTMFDGAILSWIFDIHPRVWADTLCISRAIHGVEAGGSLKALANRYQLGKKGTEVLDAIGKRRLDFTDDELDSYGDYCINDVELTYDLFGVIGKDFPRQELKIIDLTLRMFIEPVLDLDLGLLEEHLENIKEAKDRLLVEANVSKGDLMSNNKFAELLRGVGVTPPMKISPTTEKETFAFAKTDEEFTSLQTHDDVRVQTLVNARLGNKSTLEETRTQHFIDISKRGLLPVPIKYYAAHTGRWGGDGKINLQNLPSRGVVGKKLKKSMIAPEGYTLIECDSSQIEARVLSWLSGQEDLTEAFRVGDDVYKKMAATIYGVAVEDVTSDQRFVGKTTILGSGYGMGAVRFKEQLASFGFEMGIEEARRVINVYRSANFSITTLWLDAGYMLEQMVQGYHTKLGCEGVLEVVPEENAVRLPSGLLLRYEGLSGQQGERGIQYAYQTRKGPRKIYGGKVVENVCQAIARCIMGEQMLNIAKQYPVILTVHDSVLCCVKDKLVPEAVEYIESCMRATPQWAKGLPIDCESGTGKSYGACE
jgi:DNA polymerase I-like protein with 3'-5' exonuclease and polymerase domains